jgi:transposase
MRGGDGVQSGMFSYVTMEQRIAPDHPARQIRVLVDGALQRMDGELSKLYSATGRPSIAPERLLRAQLLMVLYSIRSERQLMEQLNYNLLFRWFVGLEMDDPVWDATVFTKNRERLIAGAVSQPGQESPACRGAVRSMAFDQPEEAQTDRAGVRLEQIEPPAAAGEAARAQAGGLVLSADYRSLQPGADAEADSTSSDGRLGPKCIRRPMGRPPGHKTTTKIRGRNRTKTRKTSPQSKTSNQTRVFPQPV